MNGKRIGQQTIELPSRPALCGSAAFVGRKEGEGPLGHCFDHVAKDEMYGQESFELAERQLYLDAIAMAVEKGRERIENVQFLLGGDLLNQIITASFSARELGVPFIGLYGACSTMSESLCLAGMLLDGGHAQQVVCAASSHFCTAERQYRYPLEFGSQRPPTAQWTVTGAGATLLSRKCRRWPGCGASAWAASSIWALRTPTTWGRPWRPPQPIPFFPFSGIHRPARRTMTLS